MNPSLNYSTFTKNSVKKNKIKNLFNKNTKDKELKLNYTTEDDDEYNLAEFNKSEINNEKLFKQQEKDYELQEKDYELQEKDYELKEKIYELQEKDKKTPHNFLANNNISYPELTHNKLINNPYLLIEKNDNENSLNIRNNYKNAQNINLMKKLNYVIHLLEEQQEEKTEYVTEEIILYLFLGVFVIFVIDSFVKVGKYTR